MKLFDTYKSILILVVPIVFLSACANNPIHAERELANKEEKIVVVQDQNLLVKGAPDWASQGSSIVVRQSGLRLFQGVAFSPPMGDMALQKSVADDGARAEIARLLTSYMDVVLSYYIADTNGYGVVDKEALSAQLKNALKTYMSSARVVGGWRDPVSSDIWSVAELDLRSVKRTLGEMNTISTDLKRYIEAVSDRLFDAMVGTNGKADIAR